MKAILINNMKGGGAEKVVLTLLEQFHLAKEPVQLICLGNGQFYEIPDYIKIHYLTDFEDLPKGILKIYYIFLCAFRLKRLVEKEKIDLIQGHLFSSNFVSAIARIMGSPITLQLVNHRQVNFSHTNWLVSKISKFHFKHLFMEMDTVISISTIMKADLESYLNIENHPNHIVINNPHPIDRIKKMSKKRETEFFFDENKKYLITVGRHIKRKRIEIILEAFQLIKDQLPEIELLIIGDGELNTHYKNLSHKMGLDTSNRVHFLGYQANPFQYMSQADLFVMSSDMEGLPNVLIESMTCGTPVISTDCISGPREIVHPKSDFHQLLNDHIEYGEFGILYPIGRADLLGECIMKCFKSNMIKSYQSKIMNRIKHFEAERIIEKYLATFPVS